MEPLTGTKDGLLVRLVTPTGTKEPFRPLAFGTKTKGLFSPGSNICWDKCKGSKPLSVVVAYSNIMGCLDGVTETPLLVTFSQLFPKQG